jgi:hypothetical protein
MDTSSTPLSISSPHTCTHCSHIKIYLHTSGTPEFKTLSHITPNPTHVKLVKKLNLLSSASLEAFYHAAKGISFFNIDDSLEDFERSAEEGCLLFRRIWKCFLREENRPEEFVVGIWVRSVDSMEFGRMNLEDFGWEALRGETDEEEEGIRAKAFSFSGMYIRNLEICIC